jgi:hypothetical protein
MNMGGTATYMANLLEGMNHGPFENLLVIGSVPPGEVEDPIVNKLPLRRIHELSREISVADVLARKEFKPSTVIISMTQSSADSKLA